MSKPSNDGRSMLERGRELRKLSGYPAHDRSGEVVEALDAAMNVVEAAVRWHQDPQRGFADLAIAVLAMKRPVRT